jgi:hypothetical protein
MPGGYLALQTLYVDYFVLVESFASSLYVIESKGLRGKLNLSLQPLQNSHWLRFGINTNGAVYVFLSITC